LAVYWLINDNVMFIGIKTRYGAWLHL